MAPAASLQVVEPRNNSTTTTQPPIPLGVLRASVSSTASSESHSSASSTTQPSSPRTGSSLENTARLTPPVIRVPLQSVSSRSISPSSTPSAASPYSPASTAPSNGIPSTISTYQQPGTNSPPPADTLWQTLRRWLHIRTWWQGSIAISTLVIGLLGLVYSAYRSYNLARWTAAKDFYEECQNEKVSLQIDKIARLVSWLIGSDLYVGCQQHHNPRL